MSDHDPPTVRADAASSGPRLLEELLAAWIEAVDAKQQPSLQHFLARLSSRTERDRFIDLVDQVQFAERNLPLRLREHLVIGGRYELLAPIGSGGMGQVWRALDRKLGHDVAVKVLSLAATAALDLDRLVEREGRLLAKLSHPGIVRIQDSGRDAEHRYLVMQLVGGLPLDELIEQARERRDQRGESPSAATVLELTGRAPPGRASVLDGTESWSRAVTKIVVELLLTLEAAHGAGVVHRDLKPGNVRLTDGAIPVLLDFGISIDASTVPGTMTTSMFGTAQYSAPEQWDPSGRVDVRTDVYQAGLILYEMLTLHRCFSATSPIETMQAVRAGRYPSPRQLARSIDRGLEACVLRAMEVDPSRRYGSAAEMRADLERHLAGQVPFAARGFAMLAHRARAGGRRHRRSLSLVAAMLVGAAGFWLLRDQRGVVVAPVAGAPWQWDVAADDPNMLTMYLGKADSNGELRYAPARVGSTTAPTRGRIVGLELPVGTTRIEVAAVGDLPGGAEGPIEFHPKFASPNDPPRFAKLQAWVAAMDVARQRIEEKNGVWLSADEMRGLFGPGRGSAGLEVTDEELFGDVPWGAGGVHGLVVKRELKKE